MNRQKVKTKFKEWLARYIVAELLGTVLALVFAWVTYAHTHSYLAAAGAGFTGEGIGFYGYFVVFELRKHGLSTQGLSFYKRVRQVLTKSGTNLLVEFAPAELLDTIFVRPFAMFIAPQHIKPYALGFIVGKLAADIIFYACAILGYEAKKRWLKNR